MCPKYFYRLGIMKFYGWHRDTHLIGDYLFSRFPFNLYSRLAVFARVSVRSLGRNVPSYPSLQSWPTTHPHIPAKIARSHSFSLTRYYYSGSHSTHGFSASYRDSSASLRLSSTRNATPTASRILVARHLPQRMNFSGIYTLVRTVIYDTAHK